MIKRWWHEKPKGPELGHIEGRQIGDRLVLSSTIRRWSIALPAERVLLRDAGDNAEFEIDGRLIRLDNVDCRMEAGAGIADPYDALDQYRAHDVAQHAANGWVHVEQHDEQMAIAGDGGGAIDCLYWMLAVLQKGTGRVASFRMTLATLLDDSFLILRGDLHGDIGDERLDDMAGYLEKCMSSLRHGDDLRRVE